VLDGLRDLDDVGYLSVASVYKEFQEAAISRGTSVDGGCRSRGIGAVRSWVDAEVITICNIDDLAAILSRLFPMYLSKGEGMTIEEQGSRQRTAHAGTQTFGLSLISAAMLAVVVLIAVLFDGEDIATFLVIAVIAIAAGIVTSRFDTQWARAVGLVGTVLSLGGFFLGFGILHIFSPVEFVVGLVYVIGFFMSLIAGIQALVASHRNRMADASAGSRTRMVTVGVIGIAAVVSVVGFLVTKESVSDAEAQGAVIIEMTKFEFDPEVASAPAQGKLWIRNTDPFAHDFTLDALDIKVTVGPGSSVLVQLPTASPGSYEFVCTLHFDGTTGMMGTLDIGS
jgi:plastocyanin